MKLNKISPAGKPQIEPLKSRKYFFDGTPSVPPANYKRLAALEL